MFRLSGPPGRCEHADQALEKRRANDDVDTAKNKNWIRRTLKIVWPAEKDPCRFSPMATSDACAWQKCHRKSKRQLRLDQDLQRRSLDITWSHCWQFLDSMVKIMQKNDVKGGDVLNHDPCRRPRSPLFALAATPPRFILKKMWAPFALGRDDKSQPNFWSMQ